MTEHLVVIPVIWPLLCGALMVLLDEQRRKLKFAIGAISIIGLIACAAILMAKVDALSEGIASPAESPVLVYLLGNWPSPFGISLVVDRLSALMLLLTALLSAASLTAGTAGTDRLGVHYSSLFQFLLAGLNGIFLTADLFNLFVFFEVMLAASYGLMLHGSGVLRVKFGLHYISINLLSSMLFLVGVSLIYSVTGTLNMADLAGLVSTIPSEDRALFESGAGILGLAILIKSGMWPLNFWLPRTYAASSASISAIFTILTKVGIYVLLRVWSLTFLDGAGASTGFGTACLFYGGLASLAFGTIKILAAQNFSRLVGASVITASGTLLSAVAFGESTSTKALLFYLIVSTLSTSIAFLLAAPLTRVQLSDPVSVPAEKESSLPDISPTTRQQPSGHYGYLFLCVAFIFCGLLLSGVPPFPGFLSKLFILNSIWSDRILTAELDTGIVHQFSKPNVWVFTFLLLASSLSSIIAFVRLGMRIFCTPGETRFFAKIHPLEAVAISYLFVICIGFTVLAEPVVQYLGKVSFSLYNWQGYVRDVFGAIPK